MSAGSHGGWSRRLVWFCVVGTTVVALSTLLFLLLSQGHPSKVVDAASDVIGIPMLPGVAFVSMFWGWWQAFHEGRFVLVPPVSIVADSLMIFAI
jgi:hypothetical protein